MLAKTNPTARVLTRPNISMTRPRPHFRRATWGEVATVLDLVETTVFDAEGLPTAYLGDDGETIYLWSGGAVAYIAAPHVYGWNGEHLGWFDEGVMYDDRGHPIGFFSERCPRMCRMEPMKSMKRMKRMKGMRRMAPMRPIFTSSPSSTSLRAFLELGQ